MGAPALGSLMLTRKGCAMFIIVRYAVFFCLALLFTGTEALCLGQQAQGVDSKGNLMPEPVFSGTVTASDLMARALRDNPRIADVREAWAMAVEDVRIETAYPDPQVMTTYFPEPIETRLGPQDWNITLSQEIPFPGILGRKGKAREIDAAIARLTLDMTARSVATELLESIYELLYIQEAIDLAGKNLELAKAVGVISENSYGQDKALFFDIAKAQAQISQINYDLLLLQELEQTEKTAINLLLNRPPSAVLGKIKPFSPVKVACTLDDIYSLAQTHQETLLMAARQVDRAIALKDLETLKTLPSFKLGLFYASIGQPDVAAPPANAGDDAIGIQFGMSVPLWFGKNRGRLLKAEAGVRQAQAREMQKTNEVRARISTLWFKLNNANRLMDLYQNELIPQAMSAVSTAETWQRQGNGSLADLRELQATVYNFQLSLARARADYGKTLAGLERLAGTSLDAPPER